MTSPNKTSVHEPETGPGDGLRSRLRNQALDSAMRKRTGGVPTYSIPEAAALMSISQEYLYRLVQGEAFPAVRMRLRSGHGRYVIPAKAIEKLLNDATESGACVDAAQIAAQWPLDPTEVA